MTNPNKSHITLILDRSGSMNSIASDVIGAVNGFVAEQQAVPGECSFTLVQFDDQDPYETVYDGPLANAKKLDSKTYVPRGSTPLLDAIGRGISDLGAKLSAMPQHDRPGKVIFVVQTDGLENASREYDKPRIKEMIERQTKDYNWQFVFLGANQDAIAEGAAIGTVQASSMSYAATGQGVRASYASTANAVRSFRSGTAASVAFSDDDRVEAMSK